MGELKDKSFYSVREIARSWGLALEEVRGYIRAGTLKSERRGGQCKIPSSSLVCLAMALRVRRGWQRRQASLK